MRLRRTGLPGCRLVAGLSLFSCTVASLSSLRVGQVVDLSNTGTAGVPRSVHLACGPDQGRRPHPRADQPGSPVQGHRGRRCCDHVHIRLPSWRWTPAAHPAVVEGARAPADGARSEGAKMAQQAMAGRLHTGDIGQLDAKAIRTSPTAKKTWSSLVDSTSTQAKSNRSSGVTRRSWTARSEVL